MPLDASVTTSSKTAPVIGDGLISPSVLNVWEHACKQFFRRQKISDDDRVIEAADGFHNDRLRDWYTSDSDRLDAMSWPDFVTLIRSRFLPRGWDVAIRSQIYSLRQLPDQPFDDFVLEIEKLNAKLQGTSCRVPESELRALISANVDSALSKTCSLPAITSISSYPDWKHSIAEHDAQRLEIRAMIKNVHRPLAKITAKVPAPLPSGSGSSMRPSFKLSPVERALITTHHGCFNCHRFYTDHLARDCPFPAITSSSYRPLTSDMALAAKAGRDIARAAKPTRKPVAVASVVNDEDDGTNKENLPTVAIAAVLNSPPALTTGVLGSGTDSDDSD